MFRKTITIEGLLRLDYLTKREILPTTMNEIEFENFYNEHSRPLWAYVRRLAGSVEIADDLVQESFLRFLGASFRQDTNRKAYLYRIATNLVYDYFRRHKHEMKRPIDFYEEPAYESFAPESDITEVFHELKMQERALLWLAYVEGHQHTEIAEMLGLKSLSVRVLLFRARRKLVNLLEAKNLEVNKL